MKTFIPIACVGSVEPGKCAPHTVNSRAVLLINLDGEFYCIEDRCSHADYPLSKGRMRRGKILCPLHGARFDVKTGQHLGPPAMRGVETFEVRVTDGVIEAAVTGIKVIDA